MNHLFWENVFQGAQLFLGIQLICISFFKIFNKSLRNRLLGFFTLLSGLVYFYTIFMEEVANSQFFSFIFTGPNEVFHAPLLYLYIALLSNPSKKILHHFIFPLAYVFVYKILFLFFKDIYHLQIQNLGMLHYFLAPFYFGYYFYLGVKVFKQDLNDALKTKARKKFKLFYYAFNILYLVSVLSIFVPVIAMLISTEINKDHVERLFYVLVEWATILGMLVNVLLILYVLSESKRFKKFFIGNNIFKERKVIINTVIIRDKLRLLFEEDKVFLNPNCNINFVSKKAHEPPKIVSEFIQENYGLSFNDYVSKLRVEEFKNVLVKNKNTKYDLYGIANKSGFKSRASFYRAFKKFEGITPGEFKKKL